MMPRRRPRATQALARVATNRDGRRNWLLLVGLILLSGCPQSEPTQEPAPAPKLAGRPAIQVSTTVTGPIQPIPLEIQLDENRVRLGDQL
ncbi:hypothetical protein MK280_03475, partial [Myxococcota bacterium]|nr:hypothetical protein [Myxococcota bacterium]